jgi:hypothetical protein
MRKEESAAMADTVSARSDARGLIRIVRAIWVVAAACASASAPCAEGQAQRPSVEDFFRSPMVTDAKLSPDGNYLAVTATGPNGRVALMVADLSKPLQLRPGIPTTWWWRNTLSCSRIRTTQITSGWFG